MQNLIDRLTDCIIRNANEATIRKRMSQIVATKRERLDLEKVNYVIKLINKEMGFTAFLEKQHEQRIDDCKEYFLFDDVHVFSEVYYYLSSLTGEERNTKSQVEHEIEHYEIAQKYNIAAYYGIKVKTQNRVGKSWEFKIRPILVAFVEATAVDNQWTMEEYIRVTEDILSVSDLSSGDLGTLEATNAIKSSYSLE